MRRTEFRGPRATSTFGVEPHRIDILNTIDGVAFDDASPQRMIIRINDLDSPVIGLQELIENKRAVGRTKDLADIEQLEREAPGAPVHASGRGEMALTSSDLPRDPGHDRCRSQPKAREASPR